MMTARDGAAERMAVSQHAEDIKLGMLVHEYQVPFVAFKLLDSGHLVQQAQARVDAPSNSSCSAASMTSCLSDKGSFQDVLYSSSTCRLRAPTSNCILSTPRNGSKGASHGPWR
ncbi:Os08g0201800 [Oryza sativa Japonica Group]|uniref:Os08g0201800 protein n=1 Tax=Oryza sativa subsp. japonica TaxID=39947 RepID=A0A0P0XDR0_ORYSJ|nr:Os08g0201800 [Oryza sativa Japonica Group]